VERSSLAGKLQVLKICRYESWGKVVTCWQASGILCKRYDSLGKVVTCWHVSGIKDMTAGERSSPAGMFQVLMLLQLGRHVLAFSRYIKDVTAGERSSGVGMFQVLKI
jgi:hypothetical protein